VYDKRRYDNDMRRKRAMKRLGLLLTYDGPLNDRGLPTALGDWILHRWRADDITSSEAKVDRLLAALRAHPEVAEKDLKAYLEQLDVAFDGLTVVERRALYFASQGFQAKEMARMDGVTTEAIKQRLRSARRKLGAVDTTQAVAIAIRRGLLWH
jgi:DNA-binding CsgD family transcriptional regulator